MLMHTVQAVEKAKAQTLKDDAADVEEAAKAKTAKTASKKVITMPQTF